MGEFESALGERLRGLVSTAEPSNGLRDGVQAQLRRSDDVGRRGNGARAMAAVAAAVVVVASAFVVRQVSDSGQRVAAGTSPAASSPGPAPGADGSRHPSTIRVMTANATATAGLATVTLQLLESAGYVGTGAIDAFAPSETSRVHFAPGYAAEARAVARLVGLSESAVDPTEAPVARPTSADLVVLIGQDLVGIGPAGPPTTRGGAPGPPLSIASPRNEAPIITGTTRDGRAWSLFIGGPSNDLCFGVELAPGSATRPGSCAGNPGGLPPTDPYRPLLHHESRTPPFVFGRMRSGTMAVEVVSSVRVGGRVPVIEGSGGPFYAVELSDRTKPVAVIGYRADGTSERYALDE